MADLNARRSGTRPKRVADGVWQVSGGHPRKFHVYLIESDEGLTMFDAGIRSMVPALNAAQRRLGPISRIILGHSHADHRGAAPGLEVPVWCHIDERADAEGDGGLHYFSTDSLSHVTARHLMPRLLRQWDGGPVKIAGTVAEDDQIAGFRVVHLPGHAPGLIGLYRGSDGVALVSDVVYTIDPQTGRGSCPSVPNSAFNWNTDMARKSLLKLAALNPSVVWAGHGKPITGDVKSQLEHAAAS